MTEPEIQEFLKNEANRGVPRGAGEVFTDAQSELPQEEKPLERDRNWNWWLAGAACLLVVVSIVGVGSLLNDDSTTPDLDVGTTPDQAEDDGSEPATREAGTIEGSWRLTAITDDGTPVPIPADRVPTIGIDGTALSFFTGCNRGGATVAYELNGTQISVTDNMQTQMGCTSIESVFLKGLLSAETYELSEGALVLHGGADQQERLEFEAAEPISGSDPLRELPEPALTGDGDNLEAERVLGGWVLTAISTDGVALPIPTGSSPTLQIDDEGVSRLFTGCNNGRATVSFDPEGSNFAATDNLQELEACGGEIDELARTFVRGLAAATQYRIEDDALVLSDSSAGGITLTFNRTPDPGDASPSQGLGCPADSLESSIMVHCIDSSGGNRAVAISLADVPDPSALSAQERLQLFSDLPSEIVVSPIGFDEAAIQDLVVDGGTAYVDLSPDVTTRFQATSTSLFALVLPVVGTIFLDTDLDTVIFRIDGDELAAAEWSGSTAPWEYTRESFGVFRAPDEAVLEESGEPETVRGEWRDLPTTAVGTELSPFVAMVDDNRVISLSMENRGEMVAGEIIDLGSSTVEPIAASPLRWRALAMVAWTGEEVIVSGGSNGPGIEVSGAAYNPASDSWRLISDPPGFESDLSENQVVGPGVWTGTELVSWWSGLAYNPESDSWREIAQSPLTPRMDEAVAATNGDVLVWGGCDRLAVPNCNDSQEVPLTSGAIYDPETDSWTLLPDGPLSGGTGALAVDTNGDNGVVVVVPNPADLDAPTVAAIDPVTHIWTELPPLPESPAGVASSLTWTGTDIVSWAGYNGSYAEETDAGFMLNPSAGAWRALERGGGARRGHTAAWTPSGLLIAGGSPLSSPVLFIPAT